MGVYGGCQGHIRWLISCMSRLRAPHVFLTSFCWGSSSNFSCSHLRTTSGGESLRFAGLA